MTKKQKDHWHSYLKGFINHSIVTLKVLLIMAYVIYVMLISLFSNKKYNAWCSIRSDCYTKGGSYLTVTSAGSHFFSTDFLYKKEGTWHWVHNSYSYHTDIELTDEMITEAVEAGICLEI